MADKASQAPVVRIISYDGEQYVERELRDEAELAKLPDIVARHTVTWIDVQGLGDVNVVRRLGEVFHLHRLALEDVLNHHQRAKVEPYGEHVFIIARMLTTTGRMEFEQLAMFLGERFVITFQQKIGDCFDPLRERLRRGHGLSRKCGADYLAYLLLDAVVDSYFPLLERFGEEIQDLEEAIISATDTALISRIHDVRRKLVALRRAVWPLRDALHTLVRDPIPMVHADTRVYLRDCADHTFQIMDLVDTYRDLSSDLMALYHSSLSNRMNEVMQVLTVIATIFIPLTFIVGVYGMNFVNDDSPFAMPELSWRYGYPAVWGAMLLVAGGLLLFFRNKGWLPIGRSRTPIELEPPTDHRG